MKDLPLPTNLPDIQGQSAKVYVLSEGLYNMNNSTLSLIDFDKLVLMPDIFSSVNGRGLGDTANDLQIYHNKLWIVVNISSQVEVVDVNTGISLRRISFFDENNKPRQPRFITFHNDKAYVCSFDGTVTRINVPTLTVDGIVNCGRNPDGITVANNKLYVANSGGLNKTGFDSTVSVVDIPTFKEIKKITVGLNPYKMASTSEGDVYVLSRGNNADIKAKLCKLNSKNDTLEKVFVSVPAINFCIYNDTAYLYNYDYIKNNYAINTFDCKRDEIIENDFISDNTLLERPYGIAVNPSNGNVYISDARNYKVKGDLLCFNSSGKLIFKLESVGLNPNSIIFVP